jgi:hypothetical protein
LLGVIGFVLRQRRDDIIHDIAESRELMVIACTSGKRE